jgi:hypothetical protein
MNDRAANHALGRAGPRRATVIWLWLPLAVAAAIVLGARQHASSTLRIFGRSRTSLASEIIPILNHDSPKKKSGY